MRLNVKKTRLARTSTAKGKDSCGKAKESWQKRIQKKNTYFLGKYLKSKDQLNSKAQANFVVENLDVGLAKCRYCARRRLDVTADWVACDRCEGWIHLGCEDHTVDLEGSFTCQACRIPTKADTKPSKDESVATKRKNYLETLTVSTQEIRNLEERTRGQSQTSAWYVERKKHITASNMGRVCKARSYNSRLKLVERILSNHGGARGDSD
ncbi:hypothetical protein ILUMI_21104 [Ignelater luminosus]|uniref:Zinc finger PHD-type domain-containing protein n=1 Tax=Ignelater luminosus TaxID=2038154 RepID=A0A8K0CH71_IGNLU|nr:hypothetical protein ILUMI_21104 [Ignelater luminosus]